MITKKCLYCGKEFQAKTSAKKYCNSKCCANDYARKRHRNIYHYKCKTCGKEFESTRSNHKFCSHDCAMKWGRDKYHIHYNRQPSTEEMEQEYAFMKRHGVVVEKRILNGKVVETRGQHCWGCASKQ